MRKQKANTKKKEKKKNRVATTRTTAESAFVVGQLNPFSLLAKGGKIPDLSNFPTAALSIRCPAQVASNSGGFAALCFLPLVRNGVIAYNPASDIGGVIVWGGGSTTTASIWSNFTSQVTMFRVVSWGLKITSPQSVTNASGQLYIANVPLNEYSDPYGYTDFPTTGAGIEGQPGCTKISLSELTQHPLIVPGKIQDSGIMNFRDPAAPSGNVNTNINGVGFSAIMLYVTNAIATGGILDIEVIYHVEALMGDVNFGTVDSEVSTYNPMVLAAAHQATASTPTAYADSQSGSESYLDRIEGYVNSILDSGPQLGRIVSGAARVAGGLYSLARGVPVLGAINALRLH